MTTFNLLTTSMGPQQGCDEINARDDADIGHIHDGSAFGGGRLVTPGGNIVSSTVQGAVTELDSRGYCDNLFINPFFQISQRLGLLGSTTIAIGASAYTLDRKYITNNTNQAIKVEQYQYANKKYSMKISAVSTAPTTGTVDVIERTDQDVMSEYTGVGVLNGSYATVQYVVDGADPTFAFQQFFGTGGSPSSTVTTAVTLTKTSLGGAVNQYVGSVLVPSISGKVIGTTANTDYLQSTLSIPLRSTAVHVLAMQLQYGKVNSKIRQRQNELSLCQRYFEMHGGLTSGVPYIVGYQSAANTLLVNVFYAVTKRVSPTVTKNGTWTVNNCSQPIASGGGVSGYEIYTAVTATGAASTFPANSTCTIMADAEIY